jgi:GLPGLI family protein
MKKGINITLLKVMDNKYYYVGKKGANPCGFDDLAGMVIEVKPETKKIVGFDCQKAMITFPFGKRDSFEAYYTMDLKVVNPNKTNPYRDIQGVLMQFNVKLSQIEMRFTASKIKNEKVNDDIFNIPDGYQLISEDKMIDLINKLMD